VVAAPSATRCARAYEQHRPEQTVLYEIVAEHLETYLDQVREHHEQRLAEIRRAGSTRLPEVWNPRSRLLARKMLGVWSGTRGRVLLQEKVGVPKLRCEKNGRKAFRRRFDPLEVAEE
jgi:hypothetical protein